MTFRAKSWTLTNMDTKQEEIWLQALYGTQWEDLEEAIDEPYSKQMLETVKKTIPGRKFRTVKKTFLTHILQEA